MPSGSFTNPEYGTVGLTEDLAAHAHDITVGIAWYDDLMNVEQLAEMQFAYPTFTEAVSMAAQKVCRTIGIGQFPPACSYLGTPRMSRHR